ncbi:hypothetical protein LguiA_011570 [Lonicera macranthoides]
MASSRGESTTSCLLNAAWTGKLQLLKKLAGELDCGEGLAKTFERIKDSKGRTALHLAAAGGKTHICKYFIEHLKLDVNLKDENGETPLHHATMCQHYPTTLYLLENGANPSLANDKDRFTALHYAAEAGCKDFVQLLIARGADMEAKSDSENTPLHYAAAQGKKDVVGVLLQNNANAGADPNFCSHGVSPLGCAASEGETEVIRYLLKYGANANITNSYGLTPLEIVAMHGNHEDMRILFPETARIPSIQDWTFEGVLKHVHSAEARHQRELKRKEHFLLSKSKGEAAFKKKDYLDAIFWYTEAMGDYGNHGAQSFVVFANQTIIIQFSVSISIEADPADASVLSNRSLCWARLKEGSRALSDAEDCIMLKPDWAKAHYRAGVAWRLLENYFRAADEFSEALKLDPDNMEIQAALREAVQAEFGVPVTKDLKVMHF